jgi:hypothetical protein
MSMTQQALTEICSIKKAIDEFEKLHDCKVDLKITRVAGEVNNTDNPSIPLLKLPGLAKYMKPGEFFHLSEITSLPKKRGL